MRWVSDAAVEHLRRVADWPDLSDTRYRLIELLGQGGMGTVYLAEDAELQRHVALKVLRDSAFNDDAAQRMLREARITAQLEHPGIVPLHDVGRLPDGRPYYVMKLVRGRRLDDYFGTAGALAERLRVFERICETVAFAHAHGVVHRDLKPQNVMVGEFGEVHVLDWGIAKLLADARTPAGAQCAVATARRGLPHDAGTAETVTLMGTESDPCETVQTSRGTIIGTPCYMPPEQARGDIDLVDARSDVYALGAILYFLLTGRPPMHAAGARPISSPGDPAITSPRRWDRSISRRLQAVCLKALASDPATRYASASELSAEVARFVVGQPVRAYRESSVERVWRLARTYQTPILLVLAYLLMRVLLILWPRR